jgi:hypothetical protein
MLTRLAGGTVSIVSTDYQGFFIRGTPAITSGHFGPLLLSNPGQVMVLAAELGPVLLLAPVVALVIIRKMAGNAVLVVALGVGSMLGFLFPIFIRYGLDFNTTRLTAAALWLWSVLAFPSVWSWLCDGRPAGRFFAWLGYGVTVFGGLVLFGIELIAIPAPVLTTFADNTDARYSRTYWDKLEGGAQVLDTTPERAVTLFGRPSRAMMDVYHPWEDWKALLDDPDPRTVANAGYAYIYEDEEWWRGMTDEQRLALKGPCVVYLTVEGRSTDEFPRLLDIRDCR